jgi:beta-hydroxylase
MGNLAGRGAIRDGFPPTRLLLQPWMRPNAMSSTAANERAPGPLQRFKTYRRKRIKRFGKNLIRGLAEFLGRQSMVGDTPLYDMEHFPFLKRFEEHWQEIDAELAGILKHRDAVPAFQEISPDQMKISKGDKWRTFILYGFGTKSPRNCARAPRTTALLESIPNLQTAWFSILAPGYHIPAHRGVTKGILRCHLGLIIPKDRENCWIRIADEKVSWEQGKAFVFDDTYEHEVFNNTEDERVILLFDFDRPMRFWGRIINKTFVTLLKFSAYYQEPKKNMKDFEERFEAAIRRADANLEKMSDAA